MNQKNSRLTPAHLIRPSATFSPSDAEKEKERVMLLPAILLADLICLIVVVMLVCGCRTTPGGTGGGVPGTNVPSSGSLDPQRVARLAGAAAELGTIAW